ncbi:Hsp20/alpha crystallin family protein [Streptomyces minutiscleroticus]|uniref:Hsp20/alpha crystallin family protein n=1 Tax=Streptomyces minutiscleroticus TaxID=68238 RepID=UPI0033326F47
MPMRTDPFRELDRLVDRVRDTAAHPVGTPMGARREDAIFCAEPDPPDVDPHSVDLERSVPTVRAERKPAYGEGADTVITERPAGTSSRRPLLGESLDTERIETSCGTGVLKLRIPVTERAEPREIATGGGPRRTVLSG